MSYNRRHNHLLVSIVFVWCQSILPSVTAFVLPHSLGQRQSQISRPSSWTSKPRRTRTGPVHSSATPDETTPAPHSDPTSTSPSPSPSASTSTYDVIVIGSGIGGLSAAACLASTGLRVCVCESHDSPGGAAHSWDVKGYTFESGPSLYAGLSQDRSPNPLSHVFDVVGESPEWITYDRWGTYLPEGDLRWDAVGAEEFGRKLEECGGVGAVEQWERLMRRVVPLGEAIFSLPSAAVRMDAGVALTMGRYLPALFDVLLKAGGPAKLEMPFSQLLDEENITDPFIRNWLDMICFLLQGATTKDAPVTLMAYMLTDFYKPGVVLDFPKGGTSSIVDALVRGLTKHDGCSLELNTHVQSLLLQNNRAAGVLTRDGRTLHATKAVVSNADLWSTRNLLAATPPPPSFPSALDPVLAQFADRISRVERLPSFLHLHLGIDATGLPTTPSASFPAQWASLRDWDLGVDAPRNLVLVSVASLLDPSLAPEGRHVVHAYVPATEPYGEWEGMDRRSAEYREKKAEAAEVLWRAIERQIPDVRERAEVVLVGTPLTHERFLRRDGGAYGAFLRPEEGTLDGQGTCLDGFFCCGDSTFPGIGMPAVAASGMICANSIVSVGEHWKMLDKIRLPK